MKSRKINITFIGILLLVVCLVGEFLFLNASKKQFLAKEKGMPESAISTYFKNLKSKDYNQLYQDSIQVKFHYNSQQDYIQKVEETYSDIDLDTLSYRKVAVEGKLQYNLYKEDNSYVSTLDLVQNADGNWIATTIFEGDQSYDIEVPTGLKIKINGIDPNSETQTSQNVIAKNFNGVSEQFGVKVDRYHVDSLFSQPKITVENDESYTVVKDALSNTLFVGKKADNSDYANMLIEYAKTLARFPAKEGTINDIATIAITDSDMYARLRTMQNTWFSSHSVSNFSNEQATQMIQQSEDTLFGTVTFDYYAENADVNRTWNIGYQMSLKKVNGSWKIAQLAVNNDLNPNKQK